MLATERVSNLAFPGERRESSACGAPLAPARTVRLPTGDSSAIREVIGLIRQVAAYDSTVLLLGESGTGKEVAARAIHELSPRRNRPFVAVNCGAIPAELLESELFGHEKGSFTGAIAARKGRFEIAEGGTLFLDEIGDMSPPMQVKLLRVLQERVFERVGNHAPVSCNVRIIAATHRNLEEAIRRGAFREDLFHRLNVFPIEMPPLRERTEDLPALVREFVTRNEAEGRARVQFSPRALAALAQLPWSGNVRELANLVERLSIISAGTVVDAMDLPLKYRPPEDWEFEEPAVSEPAGQAHSVDRVAGTDLSDRKLRTLNRDWDAVCQTGNREAASATGERGAAADEGHCDAPDADAVQTLLSEQAALALLESGVASAAPAQLSMLPPEGLDLREHLLGIERALVRQALTRANGVVAHAARLLSLRRTTLVERLRRLDLVDAVAGSTTEV